MGVLTKLAYVSLKMTLSAYLPVASTSSHVLDWASRHALSPSMPTKTKTKTKNIVEIHHFVYRYFYRYFARNSVFFIGILSVF